MAILCLTRFSHCDTHKCVPSGSAVRNPPANSGDAGSIPGSGTHSSILPLEIPWTEEPGKHGIAKQSDTTWRVNNSNRVGIQTPLRAAGRARPRARLSCLAFGPERHPRLLRRAGVYARCVRAQTADTRAFLMPTLILKRQSVSRAPDCVQH